MGCSFREALSRTKAEVKRPPTRAGEEGAEEKERHWGAGVLTLLSSKRARSAGGFGSGNPIERHGAHGGGHGRRGELVKVAANGGHSAQWAGNA
ncbi:hypothetical protein GCM10022200_05260 [Microbacterium awajiense]|uniref:Uncharacterized protein n=1 Tax=Microbacterium awajiense TaxID=415214 RepID=A0ABP7A6A9_9MICO